jgi:hypothetical protein
MTTVTFDTQELVIELESSGFTRQQSETVVSVLKKSQGELSTKRDIQDMDARLIQMEQRLIIKQGALMAFAIGVVAILVKLL